MKSYEALEKENRELRKYISLLLGEIELSKKMEHANDDYGGVLADSVRQKLLEKISELRNERISLESKLDLEGDVS